jgi:hypothetical protein
MRKRDSTLCGIFLNCSLNPYSPIQMNKSLSFFICLSSIILLGCPNDDKPVPQTDNRQALTKTVTVVTNSDDFPTEIICGTPFEVLGIGFTLRKSTTNELNDRQDCKTISSARPIAFRLIYGAAMEIDVSKYKDIKSIYVGVKHTNEIGNSGGSLISLYDFEDRLIEQQKTSYEPSKGSRFKTNLENLKKIVIINKAEVTDFSQVSIYPF